MKVIFDTNVFISAVWRDKTPEEVIVWVVNQPGRQWVVSSEILHEYREVLHRKKFSFSAEIMEKWEEVLDKNTQKVRATQHFDFPRDQKDAKFLACAIASNADYLVTGDSDFSDARKFVSEIANITILSVSQFKRLIIGEK
ncbi:MAG: putative toxin-antitoxin system toxin component, PIN family [Anaerolineales bacterium]